MLATIMPRGPLLRLRLDNYLEVIEGRPRTPTAKASLAAGRPFLFGRSPSAGCPWYAASDPDAVYVGPNASASLVAANCFVCCPDSCNEVAGSPVVVVFREDPRYPARFPCGLRSLARSAPRRRSAL